LVLGKSDTALLFLGASDGLGPFGQGKPVWLWIAASFEWNIQN